MFPFSRINKWNKNLYVIINQPKKLILLSPWARSLVYHNGSLFFSDTCGILWTNFKSYALTVKHYPWPITWGFLSNNFPLTLDISNEFELPLGHTQFEEVNLTSIMLYYKTDSKYIFTANHFSPRLMWVLPLTHFLRLLI